MGLTAKLQVKLFLGWHKALCWPLDLEQMSHFFLIFQKKLFKCWALKASVGVSKSVYSGTTDVLLRIHASNTDWSINVYACFCTNKSV